MFYESSDEIIEVNKLYFCDGELSFICPHCGNLRGTGETDINELLGEQFTDNLCGGMAEVSYSTKEVNCAPEGWD